MLWNFTVYNHSEFFKIFVATKATLQEYVFVICNLLINNPDICTLKKKFSPYLPVKLQFFATLHFVRRLKSVEVRGRKEGQSDLRPPLDYRPLRRRRSRSRSWPQQRLLQLRPFFWPLQSMTFSKERPGFSFGGSSELRLV